MFAFAPAELFDASVEDAVLSRYKASREPGEQEGMK
jgi:hypothetical protein